jgi:peptidoglycan/xylan/chitin deacetylase (PgdA/CDA1 family)
VAPRPADDLPTPGARPEAARTHDGPPPESRLGTALRSVARDLGFLACRALTATARRPSVIVNYHSIGTPWGVKTDAFARQMAWLADTFAVVTVGSLPTEIGSRRRLACVTFDDGHRDNVEVALPILEGQGLKGTFFLTTGLLGRELTNSFGPHWMMSWGDARSLRELGHEIGAHTTSHPVLTELDPEEAWAEIRDGKEELEQRLATAVGSFAYPKGRLSPAVKRLVQDAGFRLAVSTREAPLPAEPDWYELPRVYIGRRTSMTQFKAKLSAALDRYERFRGRQ